MAPDKTAPAALTAEESRPCDGEFCRDSVDCVCGLASCQTIDAAMDLSAAASSEPEGSEQVEIFDRAGAQRQIDLLAGDPMAARRCSDGEEIRLTRLQELVAQRSMRPRLHPTEAWRTDLAGLRENCPTFGAVTELIERAVSLALMTGSPLRLPPILLAGPPGVGKTHYCRMLAEALAISVHQIACNTNSDPKQLFVGLGSNWRAARMGVLTEAMLGSENASPLVVLDEVDKFTVYGAEDPFNVLLSVLEPENSQALLDEYLRVTFNLSHVMFIATANDVAALPPFIVDRFLVFAIAAPTQSQLLVIGRQIVQKELSSHRGHFAMPPDAVIARLARSHPRRLKRTVPLALGYAAAAGRNSLAIADIEAAEQLDAAEALRRPIGLVTPLNR